MAMAFDEIRGIEIVAEIARERRAVHPDAQVFSDLKVQVRFVHSAIISDCADLLSARNRVALAHQNLIEMTVKRVDATELSVFKKRVADDDDVAPAEMHVARP